MSRTEERQHQSTQQSGWEDIADIERRLERIVDDLATMAKDVAAARQIQDFSSDRRKSALADAIEIVMANKPDASVSAAEHAARALPSYKQKMKELVQESVKAETAIATWQVLHARFDCLRSILSTRKEIAKLV